jgi:hypothetical protein
VLTVKTSSGATAVQIVHLSRRGLREIEHLGFAHDDVELDTGAPGGPLPITFSRMGCLLDALSRGYVSLVEAR